MLFKKQLQDNGTIAKADDKKYSNLESVVDDREFLEKVHIQRMIVDESGMNCFLLGNHEIFYNHFKSNTIYRIDLFDEDHNAQFVEAKKEALKITALQILLLTDADSRDDVVFETLIGTHNGQVFHACFSLSLLKDDWSIIDKFVRVL